MVNTLSGQHDASQFSGSDVLNIVRLMFERAPLPEVLTTIVRLIEAQGDGMLCAIWLIDDDGHFHNAAAPSVPPEYVAMLNGGAPGPNDCSCGAAVARKEPVYVTDIFTDPLWVNYCEVTASFGLRACWSRPLLSKGGNVLGTFATYYREPRTPRPIDLELIEHASNIVGLAIERQMSEEELRRSAAFLVQAQHVSRTGSFSWRVETDEITWSEQLYRIFDFDPRVPVTLQLIGKRVHPEDVASFTDMLIRAQRGEDFEYEHRLLMPDRSVKYLHVIGHATQDTYRRLEYIGAIQDVTEWRLSEEALGQARAEVAEVARRTTMGELAASIAHEINQPLATVVTNAQTCASLLRAQPPAWGEVESAVSDIAAAGRRASDVIARIRLLLRKGVSEPVELNVNDVIRDVIALTRETTRQKRVMLDTTLAYDVPPVLADRVQLQQVLINLITNAADAMSDIIDRPRTLTISSNCNNDLQVEVAVADAGVGIDPKYRDRIFDPFFTTKTDGMGMGLAICRGIVEAFGGRLWATSNADFGTTVRFALPAALTEGV